MVNYNDIKYNELFQIIDKITISCDGLNDDFTERVGFNINQFYKNIHFLQKNHRHITIEIASVHSKGKLQEILEVQNYCNENNLAFKVTSRLPNNTSKEEIDKIPGKEEKEFIDNSIIRTQNKLTKLRPISICGAGYSIMSIDYNGDCYPCQSFHFPELCFGNIVENDLTEIIKSAKAKEFKEKLLNSYSEQEKCAICNIRNICGGGCPATTYKLEGNLNAEPKTMCSLYKNHTNLKLCNLEF